MVLVVDVSGSMRAEDVKPSRLAAAQKAVERFIDRVPDKLRVGVIAFSDSARGGIGADDRPRVDRQRVELLQPGQGTAIGDSLARGVELALGALGEDGSTPTTRRRRAAARRHRPAVRRVPDAWDPDAGGGRRTRTSGRDPRVDGRTRNRLGDDPRRALRVDRAVPVPPDRVTLSRIAESTGGTYNDAPDAETAFEVYERLGSQIGRAAKPREVTVAFVGAGIALLIAAAGVALVRLPPIGLSRARSGTRRGRDPRERIPCSREARAHLRLQARAVPVPFEAPPE